MTTRAGPTPPARLERWATVALWVLAVSPLALIPSGEFRFELPKMLVAVIGVGLAGWAVRAGRLPRAVAGLIAVGGLFLVVAALTSAAPMAQLLGRWPRYEGAIALPVYIGALWAGARMLGPSASAGRLRTLDSALSVTAIAVGVVGALESFGVRPLGGAAARPGSFLGNATEQGIVGMVIVAVLLLPARRGRRPLVVAGALAAAVAVVASGSRAALLGTVVALVAIGVSGVVRASRTTPWRTRLAGARVPALAVLGLAAVALAVPATRGRILGAGWAGATVEGRLLLWTDTWRLARQHLWTGLGPSGFVDAIAGGHSEAWALQVGSSDPPDSPHSWPLQALVAGGVPLLVLCLALVATVLVLAARAWRATHLAAGVRADAVTGWSAAVLGYGVALLTHFTSPGTTPLVGLLVGGLIAGRVPLPAIARGKRPARGGSAARGARAARATAASASSRLSGSQIVPVAVTATCAVWAVALGLGVAAEVVLARAVTHAAAGDTVTSDAGFSTAAGLRPWDRDVPLIAALAYLPGTISGDQASAQRAARWSGRALAATPDSVEAGRVRGLALGTLGDVTGGRRILDGLVARAPFDTDVRLAAGVLAGQAGDPETALGNFLVAVKYQPGDPIGWQDLAIVYRYLGRAADADAAQARADRLTGPRPK